MAFMVKTGILKIRAFNIEEIQEEEERLCTI